MKENIICYEKYEMKLMYRDNNNPASCFFFKNTRHLEDTFRISSEKMIGYWS